VIKVLCSEVVNTGGIHGRMTLTMAINVSQRKGVEIFKGGGTRVHYRFEGPSMLCRDKNKNNRQK
jgi:hypothetical protein